MLLTHSETKCEVPIEAFGCAEGTAKRVVVCCRVIDEDLLLFIIQMRSLLFHALIWKCKLRNWKLL